MRTGIFFGARAATPVAHSVLASGRLSIAGMLGNLVVQATEFVATSKSASRATDARLN